MMDVKQIASLLHEIADEFEAPRETEITEDDKRKARKALRKVLSRSGPDPRRNEVYFIRSGTGGPIKIGFSTYTPTRLRNLQMTSGQDLTLLATIPGDLHREHELHRRFRHLRIHGEWFRPESDLLGFIAEIASKQ